MFKNPLRKYQQGGTAPTQEQQKLLAAFIEWLPKRVKEFQGMQPDAIAQALDGMSKTPEGQQQIQQLMQQFQQEMQGNQQAFRNGGKIHDFICKHAHGGVADCGCGDKIQKGENGIQKIARFGRNVMRTTPIGKYLLAPEKNEGYRDAEWGASRLPDMNGITNRRGGVGRDINGNPVYYLGEVVNGTSADSYYIPSRGIIEQNIAGYPDQIRRTYEPGSEEYESVYNRFLPLIPTEQEGGLISGIKNTYNKVSDFLNPGRRYEREHGVKINQLAVPAWLTPVSKLKGLSELEKAQIMSERWKAIGNGAMDLAGVGAAYVFGDEISKQNQKPKK